MSLGHPCCHCALFYIYYLVGNAQSEFDEYVRLAKERDKLFQRSIENTFKFQSIRYFFWNYNTDYFLPVKMSKEKAKQITGKDKKSQTEAASKDTCPACLGTGMDHNTFADCQECEGSGKL